MIKMIITITIIYHNQNHYHNHNYLGDSIWAAAGTILAALSRALHVMNNLMLVNVLNVKNMIININIMMIVSLTVNFIILNNKKS